MATNGRVVVLLAEDEPSVRYVVEASLERAGYIVLAANDGAEALKLSRSYPGRIDLLLTDVKMPRVGGPELARAVLRERRGIRILLMTGTPADVPEGLQRELLCKPFLPNELLQHVTRVLRSARVSPG
jgi:two-component system, cell cycle sensor histidine kinase and response regulator CckA